MSIKYVVHYYELEGGNRSSKSVMLHYIYNLRPLITLLFFFFLPTKNGLPPTLSIMNFFVIFFSVFVFASVWIINILIYIYLDKKKKNSIYSFPKPQGTKLPRRKHNKHPPSSFKVDQNQTQHKTSTRQPSHTLSLSLSLTPTTAKWVKPHQAG